MSRGEIERLTPGDISNLRVEDHGQPMHVAALLLLDGASLHDAEGGFRSELVMSEIERRLHAAPRLRQVLAFPGARQGPPLWVDDVRFDLAAHVRVKVLPEPSEDALLAACQQIGRSQLDRSRPLWDITFLTGRTEGRVGMLIRLHHVVADGVASVALLGSLFDLEPGVRSPDRPPWVPRHPPSPGDLRVDAHRRRREGRARLTSALLHPDRWVTKVGSVAVEAGRLLGTGFSPRSSLNARIGTRRIVHLARGDLARAKAVAHEHGGKVNDVMLTAVAGGARELLGRRGELTRDLEIRVSVPVSRRGPDEPLVEGNRVGIMIVALPLGEPDPIARLERIVASTRAIKNDRRAVVGWDVGSPFLQRAVVRLMHHQRLVNLLLSNVPGPPVPLFFAGARVLEAFQIGVLQGNVTLGVGVLSYAGRLNFDIVADAHACPDAGVFAHGLGATLDELGIGALPA